MEFAKEDIENLIDTKIKFAEKKYGKEFKDMIMEILTLQRSIMIHSRKIELSKWNEYHPTPSVKAMRMLDYRREENGFKEFEVTERTKNNRVIVNEDNYFRWYNAYKKCS